ncbi:ankyrin repeat domain-containing protein [Caballeronia sp. LP003]|uniref:ankyrin repeat domain-containing protein n=1 Tax=Caballeronia sp. LP003 TaxID=3038551 RepID=UPI0028621804|nr:ankyrin repeat domain-containing protein [Caballeronia sp. LP003]MDR5791711.1 ankyrin repeat domain-containing protein [Caballeronia sp. LP003]
MSAKESFFDAIENGNEAVAIQLLNANDFDPNIRQGLMGGATAAGLAARTGKADLLANLISRGADVNLHDGVLAPIHMAANAAVAKMLIEAGADVNAGWRKEGVDFPKGTTALHSAARANDVESVSALLAAGADPNARDVDGATALHAGAKHPEVVDVLLAAGANIDARMRNGKSAQDLIEHYSNDMTSPVALETTARDVIKEAAVRPLSVGADEAARRAYLAASRGDAVTDEEKPVRPVKIEESLEEDHKHVVIRQAEPQEEVAKQKAPEVADDSPVKIRRADKQLNQPVEAPAVPAKTLLGGRFIGDDNGNYRRPGEKAIAIRDENNEIVLSDKQMDTFMAGLELAKSKGWTAIEVEGSKRFRREAWFHGQREGMEVVGYEPTSQDLDTLAQMLERASADQIAPGVSASLEAAKEMVVSSGKGFVAPNYENGNYAGTVLGETESHYVVSVDGRAGTATAIEKGKLEGIEVKTNELLKVKFQGGKAVGAREQTKALSR